MDANFSSTPHNNEAVVWFAMSATFGRSLKAEKFLVEKGIENYVPKHWTIVKGANGKNQKKFVPVISNLIFIRTKWPDLIETKLSLPWLKIVTFPKNGRNAPIIIPDKQMEDFMKVTLDEDSKHTYLTPEQAGTVLGKKVRIIGGPFHDVEGILLSSRGRGKKRLVVSLPNIIAVSVEISNYDLISVIE